MAAQRRQARREPPRRYSSGRTMDRVVDGVVTIGVLYAGASIIGSMVKK